MNNPKTRQQWILEQLTEQPLLSFRDCLKSYQAIYDKTQSTFCKDWNKAKALFNEKQARAKAAARAALEEAVKEGVREKHELMCNKLLEIINKDCLIEEKCYDMTIGKVVVYYRQPSAMEQIEAIKEYNRINGI